MRTSCVYDCAIPNLCTANSSPPRPKFQCNPPTCAWCHDSQILETGTGAVYSFDPVGSYEREACRAAGAASSLIQPFLDNQVSFRLLSSSTHPVFRPLFSCRFSLPFPDLRPRKHSPRASHAILRVPWNRDTPSLENGLPYLEAEMPNADSTPIFPRRLAGR